MHEMPMLGSESERRLFNCFLSHYDAPAYIRRARQVQDAFDRLIYQCQQKRQELLKMVRWRLGRLQGLAGDWHLLLPWLDNEEQAERLRHLHAALEPRLRVSVARTSSGSTLQRALQELQESIERFNRRWQAFLAGVDLTPLNRLRDDYNRYYLLEKECALRSHRLARQGFRRLGPATFEELATLFPLLSVPRLKMS